MMASSSSETLRTAYLQIEHHLEQARSSASAVGDEAMVQLIDTIRGGYYPNPDLSQASPLSLPVSEHCLTLRIYTLGPFRAFLNEIPINGLRKKAASVFRFLVFQHARGVHRDELIELFWRDTELHLARNSLNVTLHGIRQHLIQCDADPAVEMICYNDEFYQLNPSISIWIDADYFVQYCEHAQAVLQHGDKDRAIMLYELAHSLYKGDLFEDHRYEDWAIAKRERLRSLHIVLLSQLSQLYMDVGNYTAALECSQRVLESDSCCEFAHCQIMRCYYSIGQRGLAMRQFTICRDTLARELDMQPMQETVRLYELIKRDDRAAIQAM
jgi:DNA-binding SARP family transcriptional activator